MGRRRLTAHTAPTEYEKTTTSPICTNYQPDVTSCRTGLTPSNSHPLGTYLQVRTERVAIGGCEAGSARSYIRLIISADRRCSCFLVLGRRRMRCQSPPAHSLSWYV